MPLNTDVSRFLDNQNHPFRTEIEVLRQIILGADARLEENIKWNGPNYAVGDEDRVTMRINPPRKIQLVFHRGAKAKEQPKDKLVKDPEGILLWKENDRAIATFPDLASIETSTAALTRIIQEWLAQTV